MATILTPSSVMRLFATPLIFVLIVTCICSCSSYRPINYSKKYSHGYYHENHIYFLKEYRVSKRGRQIWFIMPMELPRKNYFWEIRFYRYEPDELKIEKLGILTDNIQPATFIIYTKFKRENNKLIFSYPSGYGNNVDGSSYRKMDIFIWDLKAEKFVETGYKNPVSRQGDLYQQYFNDEDSAKSLGPNIIMRTRLENEILNYLTNEAYQLPEDW